MNLAHNFVHLFYPCHSNNHKAKALHSSSLILIVLMLLVYQIVLQSFPFAGIKILGYAANISPTKVISLTNQKRSETGLPSLEYSLFLEQAARAKGEHMLAHDYWAHVAPDGTEPWVFFTDAGYKYRYAGENLARDFSNPDSAVEAWMASPSHQENLMSGKYKEIGVAVVEGDMNGVETTIIVQLFGTRLNDVSAQVPVTQAKSEVAALVQPQEPSPTVGPLVDQFPVQPLQGDMIISSGEPVNNGASGFEKLISPFQSTKNISLIVISLLLIIMVIDGIVVARRKIARIGGRTFAHLSFLGMILALVLIAKAGQIL